MMYESMTDVKKAHLDTNYLQGTTTRLNYFLYLLGSTTCGSANSNFDLLIDDL